MKLFSILFIAVFLFSGCKDDNSDNFLLNTPFLLPVGKIMHNDSYHISIYIDSAIYDGRCPEGFMCLWEGNAPVRFKFISDNQSATIKLNTYKFYTTDTTINGYKISMTALSPYPKSGLKVNQKEYRATMLISR